MRPLPIAKSAQNMDAMSKWANAKVIHSHVVGDLKGTTEGLKSKAGSSGGNERGTVSDHVEFDFDWDQMQQKMIADPVFKNFPSKVESVEKTPVVRGRLSGQATTLSPTGQNDMKEKITLQVTCG